MRALPLLLPLGLAACSSQGTPGDAPRESNANDTEVAAIINLQDRTEIDILKERVITLEREVGELKANPQAIDLDLLTKRVEALEVTSAGVAAAPPPDAPRTPLIDSESAQRAVDAAITERRANRTKRD